MLLNSQNIISAIQKKLKTYIETHNLKSLVLGISGGIDSAICAALAKPICNELGISLIGISLPFNSNEPDEIERAKLVGNSFCTIFYTEYLDYTYKKYINTNYSSVMTNRNDLIRNGNIKARLRMIYLYDIAHKNRGLVLSTDNYTEFLLGFWTLHGDVGDLGMIQSLWKTEVYTLAKYMLNKCNAEQYDILEQCINAVPTDGLGITNSDLDQIDACSYSEVDMILKNFINDGENKNNRYYKHPVIQRYLNTKYKRNNPYNFSRENIVNENKIIYKRKALYLCDKVCTDFSDYFDVSIPINSKNLSIQQINDNFYLCADIDQNNSEYKKRKFIMCHGLIHKNGYNIPDNLILIYNGEYKKDFIYLYEWIEDDLSKIEVPPFEALEPQLISNSDNVSSETK